VKKKQISIAKTKCTNEPKVVDAWNDDEDAATKPTINEVMYEMACLSLSEPRAAVLHPNDAMQ
jgi:hypothetical protein